MYDDEVTKAALEADKKQTRGCKGMAHGHKLHVLDAMNLIKAIWNGEKYARKISILRSWCKANYIPDQAKQQLEEHDDRTNMQPIDQSLLGELCSAMQTLCSVVSEATQIGPSVKDI